MFDDDDNEVDPRDLPIYKKGMEIFEVVDHICELIADDDIPFDGFGDL